MSIQVVKISLVGFLSLISFGTHVPDDGMKPLFNGRDLTGWVNVIGASDTWTVEDNSVRASGIPKSVLRTDRQYENYILEFEYRKPGSMGQAGIIIHADALPAVGKPWPRGINIQFWRSGNGVIQPVGEAKIQAVSPSQQNMDKPVEMDSVTSGNHNEWHHVRVENRDGMVTLSVGGDLVGRALYSSLRKGYIALKSDGAPVRFRNIAIRELPSSDPSADQVAAGDQGFKSIYNGLDLSEHWDLAPGHRGHWTSEDWLINYDGESEEERKSLWSKKEYDDFILMADMRFTGTAVMAESPVVLPDGNNLKNGDGSDKMVVVPYAGDTGIYVRGSSKNQVNMGNRFIGSGEIYGYRADDNMPGEVRKALVPAINADNPPGEWNRYIITMKKDRISVSLNGQLVIDDALLPDISPSGKIALQDDHATGNRFQFGNIYLKELE